MTGRVLDVRPDDVTAAIAALQRLALALFEELFGDPNSGAADRWFADAEARALDRIPLARLGWRRLVARTLPFLSDAVTDRKRWAGASPQRLRWSTGAVRARLALDAHGAEGYLIPDRLLGLVARAAWESADFRLRASTLVLDHFRSRLIASAEGLGAPRIAPGLVWMVVAVARVAPPARVRLGWRHRAARRALARVQRFAHGVLDQTALPDDFWSQWIAGHVERRYGRRAALPPAWHSRLSAADHGGEIVIRRRRGSSDPAPAWMAPEALAAAYAAWFPIDRRVARVRPGPRA
jgi:hypothetical protein